MKFCKHFSSESGYCNQQVLPHPDKSKQSQRATLDLESKESNFTVLFPLTKTENLCYYHDKKSKGFFKSKGGSLEEEWLFVQNLNTNLIKNH